MSIGAAVATAWALAHPADAVAVLAALPAWTGAPDTAPAALAAQHSARDAAARRPGGGDRADASRRSPAWLADELTRSWVGQWPALPDAMDEAARYVAPTCAQLESLAVPMGVAAATDDPVHPVEVAVEWVTAAPRAALHTVTLDELGADPGGVSGAACLAALRPTACG